MEPPRVATRSRKEREQFDCTYCLRRPLTRLLIEPDSFRTERSDFRESLGTKSVKK
jgi:hypothetical protein